MDAGEHLLLGGESALRKPTHQNTSFRFRQLESQHGTEFRSRCIRNSNKMSNYARVIHHATSILCSNKGAMDLLQLYRKVYQRFGTEEDDFWYIVKKCPRFAIVKTRERTTGGEWGSDCVVVAKTSLRLCKNYSKQECEDCQELHLCKYFVYGNCRYGKGRKPCKYSHDVQSEHNYRLLRECTLHELHEDELFLLLLQNDPSLLPEVKYSTHTHTHTYNYKMPEKYIHCSCRCSTQLPIFTPFGLLGILLLYLRPCCHITARLEALLGISIWSCHITARLEALWSGHITARLEALLGISICYGHITARLEALWSGHITARLEALLGISIWYGHIIARLEALWSGHITAKLEALLGISIWSGHITARLEALLGISIWYGHITARLEALLGISIWYGHITARLEALLGISIWSDHITARLEALLGISIPRHLKLYSARPVYKHALTYSMNPLKTKHTH
ncbi:protein mono-ADP-ribosyltransferase PARP12b isoform X4 [Alosa sapidissima]|uniref:protein mono-ADP-ribosyltransferase PARP12b isoform X4 n=1 Tax=Alosa sapidissima TaxID=34773 RepID=UPI001C08881C|nr:protein mono-ADP-ribosyltransferase PARP12b isoform X4 [Alosa sapidissima]